MVRPPQLGPHLRAQAQASQQNGVTKDGRTRASAFVAKASRPVTTAAPLVTATFLCRFRPPGLGRTPCLTGTLPSVKSL